MPEALAVAFARHATRPRGGTWHRGLFRCGDADWTAAQSGCLDASLPEARSRSTSLLARRNSRQVDTATCGIEIVPTRHRPLLGCQLDRLDIRRTARQSVAAMARRSVSPACGASVPLMREDPRADGFRWHQGLT